ncbi:MAG TPA: hypothetical protein VHB30_12495 [Solirubrobacteraceae bacterium]|jgi:hypothetical protein|nr:hypothetical protein [Solirubrobacteraceae bacterium]
MALLSILAEASEPSKAPFYAVGGALAGWAVLVAALGIKRPESFPGGAVGERGVIAISLLLVVAAMVVAALTK